MCHPLGLIVKQVLSCLFTQLISGNCWPRKITIQYRTVVFKSVRLKWLISYMEIGTVVKINSEEHEKAPFEFVHDDPVHCGDVVQR